MTTVRQYGATLRPVAARLAQNFGVNLESSSQSVRVAVATSLAIVCVLVKLLVDKGYITDADLQGALSAALGEALDPEPVQPVAPGLVDGP